MSQGVRVPFEEAAHLAQSFRGALAPFCERIEVAGSVRREMPDVGDIELVAIPKMATVPVGLFDSAEVSALDGAVADLVAVGSVERLSGAERYVKLRHLGSGLQVDLFVVRPPAQWGVIFLIRTGPAVYSQRFVTQLHSTGWHVASGALHRGGGSSDRAGWHAPFGCPARCEAIETPEEADVYAATGARFLPPQART